MATTLATEKGKEFALKALHERKEQAEQLGRIRNEDLRAGSLMYYYCRGCGLQTDVLNEDWDPRFEKPLRICGECAALEQEGWL